MSEVKNKDELVDKFSNITGADRDRAQFYLEAAGWNIDVAVGSFFQEDLEDEPSGAAVPPQSTQMSQPQGSQPSRFGTISGLKEESESSDEDRDSFYAGGSEHGAGQTVLGPKKKKASAVVQDMFKSAKEHGAEEVPPSGSSVDKPTKRPTFRGTGYKLGETEEASESVTGLPIQVQARQVDMVLKLWKNGFSVGDGPLRTYSDPANQEFLDNIKKGEVPQELIRSNQGGEVNLNMEDHREEEYARPKVSLKAFSGEGQRLGSVAPTVVSEQTSPVQTQHQEGEAQRSVSVDPSQPSTSIQIRLADGSRLVAKFNHSHLVSDIRSYITSARPQYSTATFVLMTTFPNRELTDESQSIEQAKLLNAVIVQRLK